MEILKYDSPSNDGVIYEFKKDDKLVGGAKVEIKDKCLFIKSLYVEPEYRNQKNGSFILQHIEKDNINEISRIECKLLLFSDIGYDNLVSFYEKNGYEYNIFTMKKQLNNN